MKGLRWLLAALAFLLIGCGRELEQDDGVVQIDFWNGFSGPDGAMMEKIVRRFNESHPQYRVKMQIIPWGQYYDKLTLGLAFGGAPEIFILHVNRFPEFASHNALSPLDGLMEPDDFVPRVWDTTFWEGRQYAIPLDCHPIGLYYNVDLFEKEGILAPPATLEEFLEAAKRLTKDTNGDGRIDQWGFSFTWLRSNSYTFFNQFGTSLLTDDLTRSALSQAGAAQAIQLMLDLIHRYRVAPPPEGQDAWMGFQTGKVAMALEGVYMMLGLEQQKGLRYAAAPVPQFGPKKAAWGGSHLMCLPRGLEGKRLEAAQAFMRYLSDHSLDWAKGGQVPVRLSLLESREFQSLRVQREFAKQLPYVVYEPPSVMFNQVAAFGDAAVEAAVNGLRPPKEALAEASRRIDDILMRQ
ncbi:MAG TPA: ABC transporter substrate-binding protein [Fimbriimonadaceae bacterium]|nr:ABC transporter substrate-binding protein [Fimbriimonadaceae bacterium]